MSKILVIFDIDGTLLYSNKVDSQCFADTYKRIYKQEFPTIDWNKYPHVVDDVIFRHVIKNEFNRTPEDSEVNDFQKAFAECILEKRRTDPYEFLEVPNALNTMNYLLQQENYLVGIGTGGWHLPATIKLNHLGFDFKKVKLSGADGRNSREEIIQIVIDDAKTKHQIERITYIGDAPWDVRTTRNMKMNFVGIRRNGDRHTLLEMGASHVLPNYQNRTKFLEALHQSTPPK